MLYVHYVIRKKERENFLTIFMDDLSLKIGPVVSNWVHIIYTWILPVFVQIIILGY